MDLCQSAANQGGNKGDLTVQACNGQVREPFSRALMMLNSVAPLHFDTVLEVWQMGPADAIAGPSLSSSRSELSWNRDGNWSIGNGRGGIDQARAQDARCHRLL